MDSAGMEWLKRNLVTAAGLLLALAAFITDLTGALPGSVGTHLAEIAFVATAASRGLVHAAQALATPPAPVVDADPTPLA